MAAKFKRSLLRTNKYQDLIIYSVLVPCLFVSSISLASVFYIRYIAGHLTFFSHMDPSHPELMIPWFIDINRFNKIIPWVLFTIMCMMFLMIVWTFYFSNKLIGPYERVLRELKEVLCGEKKSPIGYRKGDMFEELIKRINDLIKKLP